MSKERETSGRILDRLLAFLHLATEGKINRFCLEGELNALAEFTDIVALRAGSTARKINIDIVKRSEYATVFPLLNAVGELSLPPRVLAMKLEDDLVTRSIAEVLFARHSLPSIMVAFGKTLAGEEAAALYCLPGISPQTALREIQWAAKRYHQGLEKLN